MSVLFFVGLALFALGALVDLLGRPSQRSAGVLSYLLAALASAAMATLGVMALTRSGAVLRAPRFTLLGSRTFYLDHLTGLFLVLLFALSFFISLAALSWARDERARVIRGAAAGYVTALASVGLILCAGNAFAFLFAWELLTLSFYWLTAQVGRRDRVAGAAWSTLGMGKFSGAVLLVGFLVLASHAGSLSFLAWHHSLSPDTRDVAWVLLVVGFSAKLGVVPFQVWLPRGYLAAPAPARAMMAGVAANVGVYGLFRFFGVLGAPPQWLVIVIVIAGGVTALFGISFAGVQSSLTRVLAYSSIENAGLILVAFGVALAASTEHQSALVALGLVAAMLQTITHASAKSALFVSLASLEVAEGTDDLDALRGSGRRSRLSGATFALGSLALAGLPPSVGFVSEWFILETLMQQFRLASLSLRVGLAVSGALVALTTGLAALVFLRVLALSILGPRELRAPRKERGVARRVSFAALGLSCVVLAALTPLEVRVLARGLSPLVGTSRVGHVLASPWVLQPVFPGFSILSPTWLFVIFPVGLGAVTVVAWSLSRRRLFNVRRVAPWRSGSAGVAGAKDYSAFGFANALRHVLGNVLGTKRMVRRHLVTSDVGASRVDRVETSTRVVEPVETYLYRPLRQGALVVARLAKRLQSGSLNAYVSYMLIALVAVLVVVATL